VTFTGNDEIKLKGTAELKMTKAKTPTYEGKLAAKKLFVEIYND